jgi:hypothetical protein
VEALTQAVYDLLTSDTTLAGLLATYGEYGGPAVFTTDPAPGDAALPYIVTAGAPVDTAFDTKTSEGRRVWRDFRCYAEKDGSSVTVEAIAERVRGLLHRTPFVIDGYEVQIVECSGPVAADEPDAYGRIVTAKITMMEE